MQFALEFASPEHVLLGSDYPHQIGDMEKAVKVIENLPISAEVREKVIGANAVKLLKNPLIKEILTPDIRISII